MEIGDYVRATLLGGVHEVTGRIIMLGENTKRGVHILCHGGGSVDLEEERVEVIDPFPFENPWSDDFFDKEGNLLPEAVRLEIQAERKALMEKAREERETFKEFAIVEGAPIPVNVGDIVRVGLVSISDKTEWVWVKVTKVDKSGYEGTLDNSPIFVQHELGDVVKFNQDNIREKY